MLKRSGPNIERTGRPKISANKLQDEIILIICLRPFKYELIKHGIFYQNHKHKVLLLIIHRQYNQKL